MPMPDLAAGRRSGLPGLSQKRRWHEECSVVGTDTCQPREPVGLGTQGRQARCGEGTGRFPFSLGMLPFVRDAANYIIFKDH